MNFSLYVLNCFFLLFFFFFQAEDGIRDYKVTGVQTCALPISTLTGAGRTERHALAVHGEAVWVEADPVRVEQIVVNLLDNALKYTPPGGAIDVTIARESGHGVLRVLDTGVGIPREMLPRIFDLFVQGEPGAIRGRSGLGIGLAVVHHLA